jgi:hypothetical protein
VRTFWNKPAGKAAAQNLIHHRQRGNVGIVPVRAQAHNLDLGLVHVFLVDEVDAGLGSGKTSCRAGVAFACGRFSKAARSLASIAAGQSRR